jgi:hypothetical protein
LQQLEQYSISLPLLARPPIRFFDHSTFAGLAAVLLALPWIDYLPSGWLLGAIALNALIIYFLLAALSFLFSVLRRSRV